MNLHDCTALGRREYLQLIICSLWYDQTCLRLEIKMFLSADVNFAFKNMIGVVQRLRRISAAQFSARSQV